MARMAGDSLAAYLTERGFRMQPLAWADAERANALPPIHQDPMDRMLIAQVLNERMTVITEDSVFSRYGVPTVW